MKAPRPSWSVNQLKLISLNRGTLEARWGTSGHTWKRSISVMWTDTLHSHSSLQDDKKTGDMGQSTHWVWHFSSGNGERVFKPHDATRKIPWSETKTLSGWFSFRKKKMIGSHADKQQLWQERQKKCWCLYWHPLPGLFMWSALCVKVFWLSYLISHQSTRVIRKWVVYLDG